MKYPTRSLPPELVPYAQALEEFKQQTGIRLSFPPLGMGGGGTVLAAEDGCGKPLAIKVIAAEDAASRDQALREADILRQVQHVATLGGGDGLLWQKHYHQVDLFFLAMDYVPGQTLTQLIASQGSLAESTAIELTIAIAEWLEVLHQQNIIHRDVKPDNVIMLKLGKRYQPVVVDYGIAKVGNQTWRGARAATDGYAPPEQYKGGTDRRTDVYGLGATLYEMVTGEIPPASIGRGPRDILEPRQKNPALSLELELIIQIATAYHPGQRFSTMGEMIDALRLAQDGNKTALFSTLQALGLLSGAGNGALVTKASSPANVPPLPPLPLKRPKQQPSARAMPARRGNVCLCCQKRNRPGEVFCDDCGAALDPAARVVPASAPPLAILGAAGLSVPRTPGPQFMSLLFARQIVLGGPMLSGLGKSLLVLAYWVLLAGLALGGRSVSMVFSLVSGVTIGCSVFFFLLFPLFAKILIRWDDTVITRRGKAGWLRRRAVMLLGLAGLVGFLYWLFVEVALWKSDWFMTPPSISILVYAGLACFASILIEALLA
ncbi:MAG TPA: serine/threonine-protein kinase [Ktedonobacterales bacterium]